MTFDESEKEILKFWKEKKIYKKSKEKNKEGKPFYLMDGPPYATGHIHMGTALNKISKDIAMRYFRLKGHDVFDRAGYDTHGVPIEFKVEKEIGTKTKKDIEKYGIKKFIEKSKSFATEFIDVMNLEFENLGVWMNFEDPYLTLSNNYVETIWDVFKEADKKNLLFLGKYPIHICPRCETAVAFNEIEYSKQKDNSIFVKFPLKDKEDTFFIIWTTTPWTLPGNSAIMANPKIDYQIIEISSGEKWILAKELVPKIMSEIEMGYVVKENLKGKDLEGLEYKNPLSKNLKLKPKNAYKIILSPRYVTTEEGTGLVHCAPGHGKEDYEVGKEYGMDIFSPVGIDGILTEEAGKYSGGKAREIDREIIKDLEKAGMLVYQKKYLHDYPLCWRCKSPLLMISQPQWFLRISEIKEQLLKENEKIRWIPDWAKFRMKAWLEGISDWPVSRNRYWGTPLPIWICKECGNKKVVGSINELEKLSGKKVKEVHKPEIDEILIECQCKGKMKRIDAVLDVWFDSGVSSWAALDYMKNKKMFSKFWPANLNLEGKDQIRGWWNSQMILSQIKFGKKPFNNISMHGMVLDIGKKKMSKSLGNATAPKEIIKKYGRDYLRYYFAKVSKGEDFAFNENEFKEIKKVFTILLNVNNFINQLKPKNSELKIEDKWILSKFNKTLKKMKEKYESFEFPEVIKEFENFLINDLSKTYIKIIRNRSDETYNILNKIRINLLKIFSPICPFLTEKIWIDLKEKKIIEEESIHLSLIPEIENKKINEELEKKFNLMLEIVEMGLRERDRVHIGLRWPLKSAKIEGKFEIGEELKKIIKLQLNLKSINFLKRGETKLVLDLKITPELEAEGYAREISRKIQALRKKMGLNKENLIDLKVEVDEKLQKIFKENIELIKERTNSNALKFVNKLDDSLVGVEYFKIKDKIGKIQIVRL